jgi:hypothetical protein
MLRDVVETVFVQLSAQDFSSYKAAVAPSRTGSLPLGMESTFKTVSL